MFSFAVLTHNESKDYLEKCIGCILSSMQEDEELVIVDDFSTNADTVEYLDTCTRLQLKRIGCWPPSFALFQVPFQPPTACRSTLHILLIQPGGSPQWWKYCWP